MNKDVKVLRLQASEILKITNGVDIELKYKTVLPYSLLKAKLDRLHLDFKGDKSKEIIGVNFNYGYDTELLKELNTKIQNERKNKREYKKSVTVDKNAIKKNKSTKEEKDKAIAELLVDREKEILKYNDKIEKLELEKKVEKKAWDKDALREKLYQEGFSLTHTYIRKGEEIKETINYKFWFRTPAKSRVGDSIFISEAKYDEVIIWQDMGLTLPQGETKVVEFQAYRSLTASGIERTIDINSKNILVVNDLESYMDTDIISVEIEDYMDKNGETKHKCVAIPRKDKVKNVLFDGMAILDSEYFLEGDNFYLLRQHFFKACAFKGNVVQFLKDWCLANGLDYETAQVKDRYGKNVRVCNVHLITTENAMKFEKFAECSCIGKDGKEITSKKQMYSYWKDRVQDDKYLFGICKKNHISKFGDVQKMSYQMVNTLLIDNKEDMQKLTKYSTDSLNTYKDIDCSFINMLKDTATKGNNNSLIVDLYNDVPLFKESDFYKTFKTETISALKKRLKRGKVFAEGDNLTVCGNPYLLLLHSVGEVPHIDNVIVEGFTDPTLPTSDDYISCYTERFEEGEELSLFRNPHNAPNNICFSKNFKHELLLKYFDFGENVIAMNMVKTETQSLMNGLDEDSDFVLATNDESTRKYSKKVFRNKDYACIVNNIPVDGKKWVNNNLNIAKIDNLLAQSKNDIGICSNMAQLALSYYQQKNTKELREIVCIMSVLAQVAIDNSKRKYLVDVPTEIERIEQLECITNYNEKLPKWMDAIKKKVKKSRLLENNICTMDLLQEVVNEEVKNIINNKDNIKIETLLTNDIVLDGKTNYSQIEQIELLIKKFDKQVKYANKLAKKYTWSEEKTEKEISPIRDNVVSRISTLKITKETMYYLVKNAINEDEKLDINQEDISDSKKYKRKMLNTLYNTHQELFMQMWQ